MPDEVRVSVNLSGFADIDADVVERAVRTTLAEEGVRAGEVSVTLLGDPAIRELNRSYLGHDEPTDVISFSLGGDGAPLGDVYLGVPAARRQAARLGIPLREEMVRLAVHGTLHVLGHDHPAGPDRTESPMWRAQERLVALVLADDGLRGES